MTVPLRGTGLVLALTGGEDYSHDDGWFIAPPMSPEETPPTPSPPDGEDSALLRSFPLYPQNL